jgi:uncharacterized DUF497 family protein
MKVIWDPHKAKINLSKHRIHFSDAEAVLFDPFALTMEDCHAEGEQRHVSIGIDAVGRILVLVYTYRGDEEIRLISARAATKKERLVYEERIRF